MKIKKYEYFDVCYDLKKQYYFTFQFYFTIHNKKNITHKMISKDQYRFSNVINILLNQDWNLDQH